MSELRAIKPTIGNPAATALEHIGVTTLKQVSMMSEKELLAMHGIGPKAVGILKEELKKLTLSLKP